LKYFRSIPVLVLLSISCLTGCQGTVIRDGEQIVSLNGAWQFTSDRKDEGIDANWFANEFSRSSWQQAAVPHTWQVMPGFEDYRGNAWYARTVKLNCPVADKILKLEFDAVNRDASIWVNGKFIGEHNGSGCTPFSFIIPSADAGNGNMEIVVRVTNRFSRKALPYDNSYDWTTDGGIIRGVRLRILPKTHIERLLVDAEPSADFKQAKVNVRVTGFTTLNKKDGLSVEGTILDPSGNTAALTSAALKDNNDGNMAAELSFAVENPTLWHFDKPQLYRIICNLTDNGKIIHTQQSSFGIRKVEVKDGFYVLNGEKMRLMGVEWMPGSDPRYGFAEPPEYVNEVLEDMKNLNCVLTRFHWQQEDYIFEFMDREGMLTQEEIPTWGPATRLEQLGDIQKTQTNEMILAHYNHPSIYAWGLCNEIAGQAPKGHKFVQDGIKIARGLNPQRLLTYASNTVHQNPKNDASQYLDFIEWNEYFQSWMGGSVSTLASNIDKITNAYPDKTLVVSEYGLCECDPKNPTGDANRIEILKTHTDEFRKSKSIAGAIFFCYNDYRTHIGDKDRGVFKQRVHGVVDLLNQPKPSWQVLREESSPIKSITITQQGPNSFNIDILTRSLENDLPAYTLRDYVFIWRTLDIHNLPIESGRRILPELKPGTNFTASIKISKGAVSHVKAEVFRPTGYSVLDAQWPAPTEPKPD
jgi:beta-glucuronidase